MNTSKLLENFPVNAFPNSAWVDFLQFVGSSKPVIRTRVKDYTSLKLIKKWCSKFNLSIIVDDARYVCISYDLIRAEMAMDVDRLVDPHTYEFGKLLGYPECCSQFAGSIGESNLDELESIVSQWSFCGLFHLIDPKRYLDGTSLICHIPCSTTCIASLQLAINALEFLKSNRKLPFATRWSYWLDKFQF